MQVSSQPSSVDIVLPVQSSTTAARHGMDSAGAALAAVAIRQVMNNMATRLENLIDVQA